MKTLHLLKTIPDADTDALIAMLMGSEEEVRLFRLYEDPVDYEELLDLIFAHDKVISWW